jgi:ABC-type transport system substrate-binding protein
MNERRWKSRQWFSQRLSRRAFLAKTGMSATALATLALAGCRREGPAQAPEAGPAAPRRGGVIKRAFTADAEHLDPVLETTWTMLIAPYIYSKLLRWNAEVTEIVPDLALSMPEVPDRLTFVFKLRPGTQWWDGSPLTSEDVAFTFMRIADPKVNSPHRYKVGPLERAETPDDRTVVFRLQRPFAPFVSYAATGWLMVLPKRWVESKGDRFQEALGSGPFRIADRRRAVFTRFERNSLYYVPDRPYPDAVDLRIIPDFATLDSALITGEIDYIASLTDKGRIDAILAANPRLKVIQGPALHWNFFIMNCEKPPFRDKRVRQAINLLVDRELYLQVVHPTGGKPSGPVTWGFEKYAIPQEELARLPGYRKPKDQDIREARLLLAAAGYESGLSVHNITTSRPEHATYHDGSLALRDQLARYGIELRLDISDQATLQAKRRAGAFESHVYVNGGSQEIDEYLYGPHYTGQARNVNRYSNPELDALLDRQREIYDEQERKQLIMEIQRRLLDEVPSVWLADPVYYTITSPRLHNYKPYRAWDLSSDLYDAWVEG